MSVKQLVTAEDLRELPARDDIRYELIDGELTEVPGATALHGLIAAMVYELIQSFARKHDLGLVFPDGTAYVLSRDPDQVRIPDVSFIAWDQVPTAGVPDRFWEGAPTLAVEVISSSDRAADIHRKMRDYLDAGTQVVWLLWPQQTSVTVCDSGGQCELDADDELDGGDVLPGFRARVGDLFAVRRRR